MKTRGFGRRRGVVIAAVALTVAVVVPQLGSAAGAVARPTRSTTRAHLVAKRHKPQHRTPTLAQKRAALKRYLAAHPGVKLAGKAHATTPKFPARRSVKSGTRRSAAFQRAVAARLAKKSGGVGRRARRATSLHAPPVAKPKSKPKSKHKSKSGSSSLSLPELALFAIAPFLFMGVYLLGLDRRRRRVPKRRRASLVITPVGYRR
jgi:hypothetical protein